MVDFDKLKRQFGSHIIKPIIVGGKNGPRNPSFSQTMKAAVGPLIQRPQLVPK